jgi:hypothetical protein
VARGLHTRGRTLRAARGPHVGAAGSVSVDAPRDDRRDIHTSDAPGVEHK